MTMNDFQWFLYVIFRTLLASFFCYPNKYEKNRRKGLPCKTFLEKFSKKYVVLHKKNIFGNPFLQNVLYLGRVTGAVLEKFSRHQIFFKVGDGGRWQYIRGCVTTKIHSMIFSSSASLKFLKGSKPSYYYGSSYRPARSNTKSISARAANQKSARSYNYATTYGENKPLISHTVRISKSNSTRMLV